MKYRDSVIGVSGTIPVLWEETVLKRFCLRITDGSHFSPETVDEGYPYITVKDIKDGKIDTENALKISKEIFTELVRNNCSPQKGDVLLSKDGTIGKIAIVGDEKCVVLSSLAILTPSERILSEYLSYWLQSKINIDQMESYLAGAAIRRITLQTINKLRIVVPTIKEQRIIVSYLNVKIKAVDNLIASKEKLIQLLEEKRQAMITEAVTKGLNPNMKMKDSGVEWIGEIPEHWEISKLKNLFILQRGHDLTHEEFIEGEIPVYASNGIMGYHNKYTTKAPNITIGRSGSVGKVNYVEEDFWAHNTCIYVKNSNGSDMKYLYYILKSLDMKNLSTQTAVPTLDRKNIQNVLFVYTRCKDEQEDIVEYIDKKTSDIDETILTIKAQVNKLKEYRQSLIYEAVTGKIDVSNFYVEQ